MHSESSSKASSVSPLPRLPVFLRRHRSRERLRQMPAKKLCNIAGRLGGMVFHDLNHIMVPAAYGFPRFDFKGKNLLFGIVLIAFMMPNQIVFIPIYLMMARWDLLRTLLPQILPFAANAFGIFLLRQYFIQVPEEIIEAAKLDNAKESQIMFKIMMPMAKSAMMTAALFSFISRWNDYFWPLVMTNDDKLRPFTVGIAMLKDAEGIVNWHVIMAGNTILVIPIIIIYIFASRQIVKAFVYSGIK